LSAKYGKAYLRRHPITDYGESQKRDSNRECKSHPVHYFDVIEYGSILSLFFMFCYQNRATFDDKKESFASKFAQISELISKRHRVKVKYTGFQQL
jgi:hypothetical protein